MTAFLPSVTAFLAAALVTAFLAAALTRGHPGTVTIPQYWVNKTMQHTLKSNVCRTSIFIGLFCWKIRRKLRSRKVDEDRVFPSLLNEFPPLIFSGNDVGSIDLLN